MDLAERVRTLLSTQLRGKLAEVEAVLGRPVKFLVEPALEGLAAAKASSDGTICLSPSTASEVLSATLGLSRSMTGVIGEENHCADLFHFDVPWNPSRVEQRNGRIDRKLQRAEEVRCHYFVYEQRPEDRVLKALVEKSKTIRRELGSLAPVLERKLEDRLSTGFARKDAAALADAIRDEQVEVERQKTAETELESCRKREADLKAEIVQLQDLLEKSRDWLRLDEGDLRQAISCGLELLGARPLEPSKKDGEFLLPDLLARAQADPSWMSTLDTLRTRTHFASSTG